MQTRIPLSIDTQIDTFYNQTEILCSLLLLSTPQAHTHIRFIFLLICPMEYTRPFAWRLINDECLTLNCSHRHTNLCMKCIHCSVDDLSQRKCFFILDSPTKSMLLGLLSINQSINHSIHSKFKRAQNDNEIWIYRFCLLMCVYTVEFWINRFICLSWNRWNQMWAYREKEGER